MYTHQQQQHIPFVVSPKPNSISRQLSLNPSSTLQTWTSEQVQLFGAVLLRISELFLPEMCAMMCDEHPSLAMDSEHYTDVAYIQGSVAHGSLEAVESSASSIEIG